MALRALLSYYCYQYYFNISLLSSPGGYEQSENDIFTFLVSRSSKNTKNCQLKSLLFLSFLLFFFKAETPTYFCKTLSSRSLLSEYSRCSFSLRRAVRKGGEGRHWFVTFRRASLETRAKRGTEGRKKHDLNCAVELRIALLRAPSLLCYRPPRSVLNRY